MAREATARDRVWAAMIKQEQKWSFKVEDISDHISSDEKPSDETIRRVLRAATELGVVNHREGSPYYTLIEAGRKFEAIDPGHIIESSGAESDINRTITMEDTEGQFDRLRNETDLPDAEILEIRAEIKREISNLDTIQMGEEMMERIENVIASMVLDELKSGEM